MDAMHFGMGCCCLQLTYETQGIEHARYLYDMFIPFTSIMAAISASTPILKGRISDHDLRWEVIEQAVDCRTQEERNPNSSEYISKSRYSTVSRYISNHEYVQDFHNDVILKKNARDCIIACEYLSANNIDKRLGGHICNLFIRSPIPAYEKEFMFPCCGHQQVIPKRASQANLLSPGLSNSKQSQNSAEKLEISKANSTDIPNLSPSPSQQKGSQSSNLK